MKKVLGAVVVLLAAALLVLPGWLGARAEDAFRSQVESAPVSDHLDVRVVESDRGWFSSTATVELGLDSSYVPLLRMAADTAVPAPGAAGELEERARDFRVGVSAEVAHGPVGYKRGPFVGLARGVFRPWASSGAVEELRSRLDVPYLLDARHRIGFGGASHVELVMPSVDVRNGADVVELEGSGARFEYHPGSGRVAFQVDVGALEVGDDEANLELEALTADGPGRLTAPRLFVGDGELRVERLSLVRPLETPARTDLVGFEASGGTELAEGGDLLHSNFRYAVDSVRLGEERLTGAELRMEAHNVDRAAAERWAELSQRVALEAGDAAGEDGGGDDGAAAPTGEMVGLVHDFLQAEPVLEVDPARFEYGGDAFRARLRIGTDAAALPDRERFEALDAETLGVLARLFTAEAEVEAARGLLQTMLAESQEQSIRTQLEQRGQRLPDARVRSLARQQAQVMLSGLVEQGMLTETENGYRSSLRYEDGQLTANGQSLSLPGA